jgi:hypothetical protein
LKNFGSFFCRRGFGAAERLVWHCKSFQLSDD